MKPATLIIRDAFAVAGVMLKKSSKAGGETSRGMSTRGFGAANPGPARLTKQHTTAQACGHLS